MAFISSHTLNGVDGTHASDILVTLTRLGEKAPLFTTRMDSAGRLSQEVDIADSDPAMIYELVFATAPYWLTRNLPTENNQIIFDIVLRFRMPDPYGKYHMPIILSPNSYSTWASS
ncbi:hypothetical protein WH96_19485 [Kiloniella spongiae]|uniref:Transthyretin/hydroxyisourate hydrolase domain-containing protein n=1 Tax=Kiloniella spongiae TaxID=1489064 RepID=A0A0H2MQU7_9PROT|nr:hydroxyisourate hydrolase [Kiloniella spongiae]KLN59045.1 hypothetical protein WH96_19485 [Kiloniella spongiae]